MRVAIMQPYFFPYIGYFQLIAAVDLFVVYDNIKYTKKGWINRNRLLQDGKDQMFSLPLRSDSDALDVRERSLAADFNRSKLLNQIRGAYGRAPQFSAVFPMVEQALRCDEQNLFGYLHNALQATCTHLGLTTPMRVSSDIAVDHGLKGQDRVLAMCAALGATTYVNAIGGVPLYAPEAFQAQGMDLRFLRSRPFEYPQFGAPFVPWLSILDVMMFNPQDRIRMCLTAGYDLIDKAMLQPAQMDGPDEQR